MRAVWSHTVVERARSVVERARIRPFPSSRWSRYDFPEEGERALDPRMGFHPGQADSHRR